MGGIAAEEIGLGGTKKTHSADIHNVGRSKKHRQKQISKQIKNGKTKKVQKLSFLSIP